MPTIAAAVPYSEARDAFDAFSLEQRFMVQILLNAAGYSVVLPSANLSQSTYDALKSFEAQNGFAASGVLTDRQLPQLAVAAAPSLRLWGLRPVAYPGRDLAVWMPAGLGLARAQDDAGQHFRDAQGRLAIDMIFVGHQSIRQAHQALLAAEAGRSARIRRDDYADGDTWFAMSSLRPDGSTRFACLHQDGPGVVGFTLEWRDDAQALNPEGLAAVMAGSLHAAVAGDPLAEPPHFVIGRASSADER